MCEAQVAVFSTGIPPLVSPPAPTSGHLLHILIIGALAWAPTSPKPKFVKSDYVKLSGLLISILLSGQALVINHEVHTTEVVRITSTNDQET